MAPDQGTHSDMTHHSRLWLEMPHLWLTVAAIDRHPDRHETTLDIGVPRWTVAIRAVRDATRPGDLINSGHWWHNMTTMYNIEIPAKLDIAAETAKLRTPMDHAKISVCIIYPADPAGLIPGGIDTFIRGILRWAPEDLDLKLVGVTTDELQRPVGKWTRCSLRDRTYDFLPIVTFHEAGRQAKIPLTIRFVMALRGARQRIAADVLEFHRIEPCLAFLNDNRPKSVVMHQDMNVIRNSGSDIRWRHVPSLYFAIERFMLRRIQTVFCVHENAVLGYKKKYPDLADRFRFTPTWFDTETFGPPSAPERKELRERMLREHDFPDSSCIFIWVGRLDSQKNPVLLIDAFRKLHYSIPHSRLLLVGDGVLRDEVTARIKTHGLERHVALCGLKPAEEVARLLKASDVFVLSSGYEGMPICILEALGSGVPVAATEVGEISRVVRSGVNGELVAVHTADALAAAMAACIDNLAHYRGRPCLDAVGEFTPAKILLPIYENYRRLAAGFDG